MLMLKGPYEAVVLRFGASCLHGRIQHVQVSMQTALGSPRDRLTLFGMVLEYSGSRAGNKKGRQTV